MDSIWRDGRVALRVLTKSPGFLITAVLTLAMGIGLNATVFTVVDAVAFQPLPVAAPAELVSVYRSTPEDLMSHGPLSTSDFEAMRDDTTSFSGVVATTYAPLAVEHAGVARLVLAERVTTSYFALLGVEPTLGRAFVEGEDEAAVVVLSDTAWRRHYGADPEVIGRTIRLAGRPATVIGVAPRGFHGLISGLSPELWQPFRPSTGDTPSTDNARDAGWLWVTGRLAGGESVARARADIERWQASAGRDDPNALAGHDLVVVPRHQVRVLPGLDGALVGVSWLALGGVGLVLLIASANLANLLLARAAGRRREMATRLSLGASPAMIVRQMLTESLVLAALGGVVGWLVAVAAHTALGQLRWPLPVDIVWGRALDTRVLVFTILVSAISAVAFGLVPAIEASRTDLNRSLRSAVAGRPQRRWRRALVVVQLAISLLLLVGAGLAARSAWIAAQANPGFDAEDVVVASFAPRWSATTTSEAFYDRLRQRVGSLPGVESVALASHLPLTVETTYERVWTAGEGTVDDAAAEPWPRVDTATVDPGYFTTMKIAVEAGRGFTAGDTIDTAPVAVVNAAFARRFWPAGDAVGQRLRIEGTDREYHVTGVVADGKYRGLGDTARPFLYLTFAQDRWQRRGHGGEVTTGTETLIVRTAAAPGPILAQIRRIARDIDPDVVASRFGSLHQAIAPATAPPRWAAGLFGLFAVLGLVLAVTGLYAVIAYTTSRRGREIGIRMALGARRADIVALVLREGVVVTALGLGLGLALAAVAARLAASWLYGVTASDPVVWLAMPLCLAGVAVLASYLPARRAVRANPQAVLRRD